MYRETNAHVHAVFDKHDLSQSTQVKLVEPTKLRTPVRAAEG